MRLEDLNLQGMKALWRRKVSDLGFADFVKELVYIADKKGVKIIPIHRDGILPVRPAQFAALSMKR